jgi:hypothetical protein
MITGAASELGMNLVTPIPSVVNAAVPRASVAISAGNVDAGTSTP